MLGPSLVCSDERKIDLVLLRRRKRDLRFFGLLFNALNGVRLLGKINAGISLELVGNPIHETIVPVIAAEMCVAVGGTHFKNAVADFQHRDVEGAAAEVVHCDFLVLLFIEPISERCCCGFVDDAQHFEAGNLARILSRVTL